MSFPGSGNSLCKGPGEEMCLVFSRLARKAVQLKWSELEGEKQKEVREGAGSQVTQSPADHVMECGLCSQGEPRLLSRNLLAVFLGGSLSCPFILCIGCLLENRPHLELLGKVCLFSSS